MADQTARLFAALGATEAVELLVTLLEIGEGSVGRLVDAVGCSQPTASRYLKELASLGVLRRTSTQGAYLIACPDEVRTLLDAAVATSVAVLAKRREAEAALQRRVRRTRFSEAKQDDDVAG
jgi:DNA-binding IclR family transcriptional regulator